MRLRRAVEARRGTGGGRRSPGPADGREFRPLRQCASVIPAGLRTVIPERRYCPSCAPGQPRRGGLPRREQPAKTVPWWAWAATLTVMCLLIAADLLLSRGAGGRCDEGLMDRRRACLRRGPLPVAGAIYRGPVLRRLPAGEGPQRRQHLHVHAAVRLTRSARRAPAAGPVSRSAGPARTPRRLHRSQRCAHRPPQLGLYAFGALVLLAGVRMFRPGAIDLGSNLAVRGSAGCCQLTATTPGELACPLVDRHTGGIRANPEPPFGAAAGSRSITTRAARIGQCVFALAGLPRSRSVAGRPRPGPPAARANLNCDASEAPSPAV